MADPKATTKAAKVPPQNATGELEIIGKNFALDELASLKSWDDAIALLGEVVGETHLVIASEVLGDGFKMLDKKEKLIGTEMLLITWSFHTGEHGEFVAVKCMTKAGEKFVMVDGSTGICDQLMSFSAKARQQGGMFVKNGLRKSDYKYTDENGEEKNATTYYLDTSA